MPSTRTQRRAAARHTSHFESLPEDARDRTTSHGQRDSWWIERWGIHRALRLIGSPRIVVELWDGRRITANESGPVARIVILDPGALWGIVRHPDLGLGEGFADGRIVVEGDLADGMTEIARARHATGDLRPRAGRRRARRPPSTRRARSNVEQHYDVGNDFYELWLDEQLVYTCAYFERTGVSLEDAQRAKLDHVCRKLRLQPGERVVECGCGWGALALHMAREYGVNVRAYNVSSEQLAFARERARREGLDDRVEFVGADWREAVGPCDAFVSVGMLEHVGVGAYEQLGRVIDRCLVPEGRGLVHSIGVDWPRPLNRWISDRIFPGAEPPTLAETMRILEPNGFTVLDVENLRLHYAETLEHWLRRYEAAADDVEHMFDARLRRAWHLYLAGSLAAFRAGGLQLFQVVFNRAGCNDVPRTRAHQYDVAERVPHGSGEVQDGIV